MAKLELEYRDNFRKVTDSFAKDKLSIIVTPPIDEDYWIFRVKLFKDQAIIAFPKFNTMGIGFAIEDDWNTNLPYQSETKSICNHIWCNRKYNEITKATCIRAIKILQKASKYYMEHEQPKEPKNGNANEFVGYMKRLENFVKSK